MLPRPVISVIIPLHNAVATIGAAVLSALKQSYTGPLELCVFDDASTDGSRRAVIDIATSLRGAWPHESARQLGADAPFAGPRRIQLSNGYSPHGPAFARNRAVSCSTGSFLCLLDADDVAAPDRVDRQLSVALHSPRGPRSTLVGGGFSRVPADATPAYTQWANSLSDEQLVLQQWRECTLIQPTWFMHRDLFCDTVGGYDERLPLNLPPSAAWLSEPPLRLSEAELRTHKFVPFPEDTVFWHRALAKGVALATVRGDPVLTYTFSSSSQSWKISRTLLLRVKAALFEQRWLSPSSVPSLSTAGASCVVRVDPSTLSDARPVAFSAAAAAAASASARVDSENSHTDDGGAGGTGSLPSITSFSLELPNEGCSDSGTLAAPPLLLEPPTTQWGDGFVIWGAGRDGKAFYNALSPTGRSAVRAFLDIDPKKIGNRYPQSTLRGPKLKLGGRASIIDAARGPTAEQHGHSSEKQGSATERHGHSSVKRSRVDSSSAEAVSCPVHSATTDSSSGSAHVESSSVGGPVHSATSCTPATMSEPSISTACALQSLQTLIDQCDTSVVIGTSIAPPCAAAAATVSCTSSPTDHSAHSAPILHFSAAKAGGWPVVCCVALQTGGKELVDHVQTLGLVEGERFWYFT